MVLLLLVERGCEIDMESCSEQSTDLSPMQLTRESRHLTAFDIEHTREREIRIETYVLPLDEFKDNTSHNCDFLVATSISSMASNV